MIMIVPVWVSVCSISMCNCTSTGTCSICWYLTLCYS